MKKLEEFLKDVERVAESAAKLLPANFKPEMKLYLACDLEFVQESDYKPKIATHHYGGTDYRFVRCEACLNVERYSQRVDARMICRELFDRELRQQIQILIPGVGEVEVKTTWAIASRYG